MDELVAGQLVAAVACVKRLAARIAKRGEAFLYKRLLKPRHQRLQYAWRTDDTSASFLRA